MTYGRELMSFIIKHNVNDDVLVLVATFAREEESANNEVFPSDIEERPSMCVETFGS